jgi:methyltransferase-like protein
MDFVRNRQFRQTLLCHADAGPKRALTPEFMHGLMVSSRAVADTASPDLAAGTMVTFRIGAQRADTALPGTKAALAVLMEMWPEAIDVDALCAIALQRAAPFLADTSADEARRGIIGDLFGGVMYGMVKLHSQPPSCTNSPSDIPRAHPYAAYQVRSGHTVVNAHHEMIELEALAVEVLKLADGRRRRSNILDALVERFERGTLEMEDGGAPVTDASAARTILADRLEKAIASLTNSALLIA